MESLEWWVYWILAYTAGLAHLTVDILRAIKGFSTKESVVFSASLLLLIIVATMSEYQNHCDIFVSRALMTNEMGHFWYHGLMLTLILISCTLPVWIHSTAKFARVRTINRCIVIAALLYSVVYVVSIPFGFTRWMISIILVTVIVSCGYGLYMLSRSPRNSMPGFPFNRLLVAICLAMLPPVVLFDMFYADLQWVQRLSPVRFSFFPLLYTLFCLVRVVEGIVLLSSQNLNKSADGQFWEAIIRRYNITDRETEVMKLLMDGKNYGEIGQCLFISTSTVKTHIQSLYRKTGCSSKIELFSMLHSLSGNRRPG